MSWPSHHPVSGEALSQLSDGSLSVADRHRVETHVRACEACRETLSELRGLRSALVELRASAPRSFAVREADIRAEALASASPVFSGAMPMLSGVAAAAFLAFGVLVGVDMSGGGARDQNAGNAVRTFEEGAPLAPPDEAGNAAVERSEQDDYEPALTAAPAPSTNVSGLAPGTPVSLSETGPLADDAVGGDGEVAAAESAGDGGGNTALRAAEVGTAALALVAGLSFAVVWWRRRT